MSIVRNISDDEDGDSAYAQKRKWDEEVISNLSGIASILYPYNANAQAAYIRRNAPAFCNMVTNLSFQALVARMINDIQLSYNCVEEVARNALYRNDFLVQKAITFLTFENSPDSETIIGNLMEATGRSRNDVSAALRACDYSASAAVDYLLDNRNPPPYNDEEVFIEPIISTNNVHSALKDIEDFIANMDQMENTFSFDDLHTVRAAAKNKSLSIQTMLPLAQNLVCSSTVHYCLGDKADEFLLQKLQTAVDATEAISMRDGSTLLLNDILQVLKLFASSARLASILLLDPEVSNIGLALCRRIVNPAYPIFYAPFSDCMDFWEKCSCVFASGPSYAAKLRVKACLPIERDDSRRESGLHICVLNYFAACGGFTGLHAALLSADLYEKLEVMDTLQLIIPYALPPSIPAYLWDLKDTFSTLIITEDFIESKALGILISILQMRYVYRQCVDRDVLTSCDNLFITAVIKRLLSSVESIREDALDQLYEIYRVSDSCDSASLHYFETSDFLKVAENHRLLDILKSCESLNDGLSAHRYNTVIDYLTNGKVSVVAEPDREYVCHEMDDETVNYFKKLILDGKSGDIITYYNERQSDAALVMKGLTQIIANTDDESRTQVWSAAQNFILHAEMTCSEFLEAGAIYSSRFISAYATNNLAASEVVEMYCVELSSFLKDDCCARAATLMCMPLEDAICDGDENIYIFPPEILKRFVESITTAKLKAITMACTGLLDMMVDYICCTEDNKDRIRHRMMLRSEAEKDFDCLKDEMFRIMLVVLQFVFDSNRNSLSDNDVMLIVTELATADASHVLHTRVFNFLIECLDSLSDAAIDSIFDFAASTIPKHLYTYETIRFADIVFTDYVYAVEDDPNFQCTPKGLRFLWKVITSDLADKQRSLELDTVIEKYYSCAKKFNNACREQMYKDFVEYFIENLSAALHLDIESPTISNGGTLMHHINTKVDLAYLKNVLYTSVVIMRSIERSLDYEFPNSLLTRAYGQEILFCYPTEYGFDFVTVPSNEKISRIEEIVRTVSCVDDSYKLRIDFEDEPGRECLYIFETDVFRYNVVSFERNPKLLPVVCNNNTFIPGEAESIYIPPLILSQNYEFLYKLFSVLLAVQPTEVREDACCISSLVMDWLYRMMPHELLTSFLLDLFNNNYNPRVGAEEYFSFDVDMVDSNECSLYKLEVLSSMLYISTHMDEIECGYTSEFILNFLSSGGITFMMKSLYSAPTTSYAHRWTMYNVICSNIRRILLGGIDWTSFSPSNVSRCEEFIASKSSEFIGVSKQFLLLCRRFTGVYDLTNISLAKDSLKMVFCFSMMSIICPLKNSFVDVELLMNDRLPGDYFVEVNNLYVNVQDIATLYICAQLLFGILLFDPKALSGLFSREWVVKSLQLVLLCNVHLARQLFCAFLFRLWYETDAYRRTIIKIIFDEKLPLWNYLDYCARFRETEACTEIIDLQCYILNLAHATHYDILSMDINLSFLTDLSMDIFIKNNETMHKLNENSDENFSFWTSICVNHLKFVASSLELCGHNCHHTLRFLAVLMEGLLYPFRILRINAIQERLYKLSLHQLIRDYGFRVLKAAFRMNQQCANIITSNLCFGNIYSSTALPRAKNLAGGATSADELIRELATPTTELVGLENPGSVCYINSVLQQVFNIPIIRDYVFTVEEKNKTSPLYLLQEVFANLLKKEGQPYLAENFYAYYQLFKGTQLCLTQQEDVCFFLENLIEQVDDRLAALGARKMLNEVFGGAYRRTNTCDNCGLVTSAIEKFVFVPLPMSTETLIDEFWKYISVEIMENTRCDHCEQKKEKYKIHLKFQLEKLPPCLCVHFQRVHMAQQGTRLQTTKNNKFISFPNELDVAPFVSEEAKQRYTSDESVLGTSYVLTGVICHYGTGTTGHYFSFIKTETNPQQWYCLNDGFVGKVDDSSFEQLNFGTRDKDAMTTGSGAYLLFYMNTRAKSEVQLPNSSMKKIFEKFCKVLVPRRVLPYSAVDNSVRRFHYNKHVPMLPTMAAKNLLRAKKPEDFDAHLMARKKIINNIKSGPDHDILLKKAKEEYFRRGAVLVYDVASSPEHNALVEEFLNMIMEEENSRLLESVWKNALQLLTEFFFINIQKFDVRKTAFLIDYEAWFMKIFTLNAAACEYFLDYLRRLRFKREICYREILYKVNGSFSQIAAAVIFNGISACIEQNAMSIYVTAFIEDMTECFEEVLYGYTPNSQNFFYLFHALACKDQYARRFLFECDFFTKVMNVIAKKLQRENIVVTKDMIVSPFEKFASDWRFLETLGIFVLHLDLKHLREPPSEKEDHELGLFAPFVSTSTRYNLNEFVSDLLFSSYKDNYIALVMAAVNENELNVIQRLCISVKKCCHASFTFFRSFCCFAMASLEKMETDTKMNRIFTLLDSVLKMKDDEFAKRVAFALFPQMTHGGLLNFFNKSAPSSYIESWVDSILQLLASSSDFSPSLLRSDAMKLFIHRCKHFMENKTVTTSGTIEKIQEFERKLN